MEGLRSESHQICSKQSLVSFVQMLFSTQLRVSFVHDLTSTLDLKHQD